MCGLSFKNRTHPKPRILPFVYSKSQLTSRPRQMAVHKPRKVGNSRLNVDLSTITRRGIRPRKRRNGTKKYLLGRREGLLILLRILICYFQKKPHIYQLAVHEPQTQKIYCHNSIFFAIACAFDRKEILSLTERRKLLPNSHTHM